MPNPTRIFISSAYDTQLIPLRLGLKTQLEESGHYPLLFEENFFPWESDFMDTCLRKVEESDIFILIINQNVGTYWEEDKTTPTYMEFYTAIKEGKYIIAFLDVEIRDLYNQHIKDPLKAKYNEYFTEHNKNPDYTIDIVRDVLQNDVGKYQLPKISHIHPFIWAFIYDVQYQNIWTENLVIAESPNFYSKVKSYLSDRLGEGIKLVPMKKEIYQNAIAANEFTLYQDYTSRQVSFLEEGKITDWTSFLYNGISPLQGGEIYRRPNTALAERIGTFQNCNAMTVYKRVKDKMKLCGCCGSTTPTPEYNLNDEESYVATSYNQNTTEIGYSEEKNLLYYTLKTKEYVLCFHYPINMISGKATAYKKEINCAIISNTLFTDFLADLIGGLNYEE
ncbi:DUF4062 domain-containing protein [Bacillus toyonensis]|uniref:DUF4062 domain-containing protein n=2 Tax=Bacillus cereus group TaxID=86661 RepID=UPI0015CF535B|nr:DUF4062 domain-containing protein [Bacillus toyonensis]